MLSLLELASEKNHEDEWYPVAIAMLSHTLDQLMEWLEAKGVGDDALAKVEWLWMPLLENGKRGMPTLQRLLSSQPRLFVDMLKVVFRGEDDAEEAVSESDEMRARQADSLLRKWNIVPGSKRVESEEEIGGSLAIDQEALRNWITEAREQAKESGRLGVCDGHIGQVFAHASADDDGTWPGEAVRNIIEELASSKLESGMHTGVMNKRGVVFRARGGEQERELAAKYSDYRDKVIDRWPRTGSMLDGIRKSYERQAKMHDEMEDFEEFT